MQTVVQQAGVQLERDAWLRVEDAAALSGQSVRHWQWMAKREAKRGLACKIAPPEGGKPVWHVHRSLSATLTRFPTKDEREQHMRAALVSEFPEHKVEQAYRRAHWLREWRKLCDARRDATLTEADLAERIVAQAKAVEGEDFPIGFRSLQLWHAAYQTIGPAGPIRGVSALVDRRGVRATGVGSHEARTQDAIAYFYSVYHTQNRATVKTCHVLTMREARKHGWTWPDSYSATRKWLKSYDDLSLTCLMREGRIAWQHRFMAYLEPDYTKLEPGELYVCDHTQCDFWVAHGAEQLRPWLTVIQDARTRCIVGWHMGIAPHQDGILAAMHRAFRDWALPHSMRIDNGRDFTSKLITGMTKAQRDRLRAELGADWFGALRRSGSELDCVDPRFMGVVHELGIKLIYAIPYSPWSKATLERFFGTFEDQVGKSFATYCGNSTLTRPECLEAIRRGYTKEQKRALRKRYGKDWKRHAVLKIVDQGDVPTLEDASAAFAGWLTIYHATAHRGDGMHGRTPLTVWNEAASLRKASEEALLFLFQARGVYRVGPNGVRFKVGNDDLTYGRDSGALARLRGREVFIRIDHNDLSHCHAFSPDEANRKYVGRLESNERIPPLTNVDDLRVAVANIQRSRKVGRQASRDAHKRTRGVAAELTAMRRERAAELRKTGTDDRASDATIRVVRTRFEGLSEGVQIAAEPSRPRMSWADGMKALTQPLYSEEQPDADTGDLSDLFMPDVPRDEESDDSDSLRDFVALYDGDGKDAKDDGIVTDDPLHGLEGIL